MFFAVVPEGVTVAVSPDDCLGALPFEMITLNGEGRIQETAGLPQTAGAKFLGDRNPVVYCQSITALSLTRTLANPTKPEDRLLGNSRSGLRHQGCAGREAWYPYRSRRRRQTRIPTYECHQESGRRSA